MRTTSGRLTLAQFEKRNVIECVCGGSYTHWTKKRHFNTPQCKNYQYQYFNPETYAMKPLCRSCM